MEVKRVDSKLLLLTAILVLITLLLLNYFLQGNKEKSVWDYEEKASVVSRIDFANKVEDRQLFYNIEEIVVNYLNSYINVYNEDKLMYEDYYDFLTKEYKKQLSKREYKELAENFLNRFYYSIDSEYEKMYTSKVLKNIYKFEDNIYICKLYNESNNEEGYIVLELDNVRLEYKIVYIQ